STSDIRFGDDLDERHPGPVEVDARGRHALSTLRMKRLSRIFLEVDPHEPDPLPAAPRPNIDAAAGAERPIVLGDLITLGEVRVEIVLPGEDAPLRDLGADGQARHDREPDRALVQHGKHARESEADRADLRVGPRAELRAAAAENLRLGPELGM